MTTGWKYGGGYIGFTCKYLHEASKDHWPVMKKTALLDWCLVLPVNAHPNQREKFDLSSFSTEKTFRANFFPNHDGFVD